MRELRFDGLSPDGMRLVLAGNDGQKYTVAIDERLEAAVRRDRARMSQVELEQSGVLRPREIQARIRAGATAEDVAAASGLTLEHVRRFEGPVLTERAWVAQQAQATEVRRPGGDIELGELVAERLGSIDVEAADVSWDAWRRDDGLWVVIATFPVPPNTHIATWTYDSGGRTMTMVDENARALSAIEPDAPLELAPPRPTLTAVAPIAEFLDEPGPRSAAERGGDAADESPGAAEPGASAGSDAGEESAGAQADQPDEGAVDKEKTGQEEAAAEATGAEAADQEPTGAEAADQEATDEPGDEAAGPTADAVDVPLFEAPEGPPQRPAGKPHIPSFDDILFGPGRSQ